MINWTHGDPRGASTSPSASPTAATRSGPTGGPRGRRQGALHPARQRRPAAAAGLAGRLRREQPRLRAGGLADPGGDQAPRRGTRPATCGRSRRAAHLLSRDALPAARPQRPLAVWDARGGGALLAPFAAAGDARGGRGDRSSTTASASSWPATTPSRRSSAVPARMPPAGPPRGRGETKQPASECCSGLPQPRRARRCNAPRRRPGCPRRGGGGRRRNPSPPRRRG